MTKRELLHRLRTLQNQSARRKKTNKYYGAQIQAKGAERAYRNAYELVELLEEKKE